MPAFAVKQLRQPVLDLWAGALTACVFYAEYVSLGAALGDTLPGRSGSALGALMVLGAVVVGSVLAIGRPRALLIGPRSASLAVLIAGMKFAIAQAGIPEAGREIALTALLTMLMTAAAVQLLGLLPTVQRWISHSNVALRKGFMFATGVGIVVGLGTTQLKGCLHIDPVRTAAVTLASVIAGLTWNSLCKYPGLRHTAMARLAPLAIPVSVALATAGYYLFIANQVSGGYCGTIGSSGLHFSLLQDIVISPYTLHVAWHHLPLWVWPALIGIGLLLGCVMLLESMTTLRDSKDGTDRVYWPAHVGGLAFTNAISALLGLSCSCLSTSRTNALIESHGRTRVAVLAHGLGVLCICLFLTGVISLLPQLAIAVALMIVAIQTIDEETRRDVWANGYSPGAPVPSLHTSWIFLGMVGGSTLAGVGLMQMGWGFGGGPLLVLAVAALLLRPRGEQQ
ncbi:SulP family inorganic anion transporter [Herbaspirillum lusitanum]|uniref:SulP family inorganic anion transporter n=1 Tax=Herbaspirillum lusitanum TaxID=213312 RepID=A0ABW9A650_9BURK